MSISLMSWQIYKIYTTVDTMGLSLADVKRRYPDLVGPPRLGFVAADNLWEVIATGRGNRNGMSSFSLRNVVCSEAVENWFLPYSLAVKCMNRGLYRGDILGSELFDYLTNPLLRLGTCLEERCP